MLAFVNEQRHDLFARKILKNSTIDFGLKPFKRSQRSFLTLNIYHLSGCPDIPDSNSTSLYLVKSIFIFECVNYVYKEGPDRAFD